MELGMAQEGGLYFHSCSGSPHAGTGSLHEPAAPQNPFFFHLVPLMTSRPALQISWKETQSKAELDHFFGMRVLSQP